MIRQTIIKQPGKHSGWLITTSANAHVYRQCSLAGTKRDAQQTAHEERVELCRIMADEVGG